MYLTLKKLIRFFILASIITLFIVPQKVNAQNVFSDSFNRPDAPTLGPNWVEFYGTRTSGIFNNQAYITTISGGAEDWGQFKVAGMNTQDQVVQVTYTKQSGDVTVMARIIDINNRIMANYNIANILRIYEVHDGNYRAISNTAPVATVGQSYTIKISAIGSDLKVYLNDILIASDTLQYLTSGSAGFGANGGYTNIFFDNFSVTNGNTPTPTPTSTPIVTPTITSTATPTVTPTLTPTPTPTPIPISKVVLVPGLGASWNADAIVNCKTDGYSGDWTLAPYAKNIYEPLISALTNAGWKVRTFYYDWRSDVRDDTTPLSNYINSNTEEGEKVNFVGHSLGGLVGRAYMIDQSGGKLNSYISVGTPHQGSVLSYPVAENNQIWNGGLIEKIAETIITKKCGVPPSTYNLLPTFDYLKNWKTQQMIPVSSMFIENNWLPNNFTSPFWGVRVGTLSGTGYPTINSLDVIANKSWPDGRPIRREAVNEGDGTVLTTSSQLSDASYNEVANQTHSGLVGSTEGISKIMEFLGSAPPEDPPFTEPTSALIIIGYPGNFWLKDSTGSVIHDENGMIALVNPKNQTYEMQIIPQGQNTTVIVAQFLEDGKTSYKEYRYHGPATISKELSFNSKYINSDPIKDKKVLSPNPQFKFFMKFWNFFKKYYPNHH